MLYGTVATSFRSGGFFFTSDNPSYGPEDVIAYTLGSKNRLFENKVQLNIELFDWSFQKQQIAYLTRDSRGDYVFATVNAGKTRERGVELSLKFQVDQATQLGVDVQYLDARFQEFKITQAAPPTAGSLCSGTQVATGFILNCEGRRPTNAPEWVVGPTVSHNFLIGNGGSVDVEGGAHYQSSSFTAIQLVPSDLQPAYITGNASLTYNVPGRRLTVGVFVENVADVAIKQYSAHSSFTAAVLGPPRTFGVRAQVHL